LGDFEREIAALRAERERDGQERDGQDRDGQDRDGQDRDGQDRDRGSAHAPAQNGAGEPARVG
jgi:transcription termination factor Rho